MNSILEKTYVAEAAINANRIVKFGAADGGVIQAAAAADLMIGVASKDFASVIGERTDVMRFGIAQVKLGGAVTRGQPVTSDATGQGVVAAPGAGVNVRIIGFAETSGVIGDIIDVQIAPSVMQG